MTFPNRLFAKVSFATVTGMQVALSLFAQPPARDEITVVDAKPSVIDEKQWSPVPEYLRGATVFKPSKGNTIDLTAQRSAQVVIAATWALDGDPSSEWYNDRKTLPELVAEGWEPIGKTEQKGKGEHRLLRKSLHAGEHVSFHTRKANPPVAFLVASEQADALAAAPTVLFTCAELSGIKPPQARLATAAGKGVVLRAHEPAPDNGFFERGIVLRELARQAVLLAAREELGLPTRDDTLRERSSGGEAAGPQPLDVVVEVHRDGRVNLTLFRFVGDKPGILWDKQFVLKGEDLLLALVSESERLSREEFRGALQKAGFDGNANRTVERAVPVEQIQKLLAEMHPIAQFDAARQLHASLHAEGESPERLADLARAYANLSVLTEHLWFPGHKVFKARALLYAERGVRRWPNSHVSLAGRAYARALAGLHEYALTDINKLESDANSDDATSQGKSELRLLGSLCRFELDKLDESNLHPNHRQLSLFLRLISVERFSGTVVTLKVANQILEAVPDSDRSIDAIYETRRLGTLGEASQLGLERTLQELYPRLQKMSGLPDKVVAAAKAAKAEDVQSERKQRLALIRLLRVLGDLATDDREPSWQTLATWIEEVAFLQSVRQLEFLATGLSVPLDDARQELEGLLADHPYRGFLATLNDNTNVRREKLAEFAKTPYTDAGLNETYMWTRLSSNGFNEGRQLFNLAYHHQDWIYRDLLKTTRVALDDMRPTFASHLRRVSPHSPVSVATTIEYDWDFAAKHAQEWEQRFVESPQVQGALGKQYAKQQKYADAVRCLTRTVAALPEYESYTALAESWLKLGNEKKWQATWDDFLEQPNFGLEQARARVAVAEHFMLDGKFQEALPYAQDAGATGAEWALVCAGDCLTGLKRWSDAERYFQIAARRYPYSATGWYFWCQRTGQGNLSSAHKEVRAVIANPQQGIDPASRAVFLSLEGDKKQALQVYREALARRGDWLMAWRAAVLADELKEPKVRDEMLTITVRVASMPELPKPIQVEFAKLAQEALADTSKLDQFAEDVKELMKKIDDPREKASTAYFAGRLLLQQDHKEGQALVEQAARLPFNGLTTTVASVDIRQQSTGQKGSKR